MTYEPAYFIGGKLPLFDNALGPIGQPLFMTLVDTRPGTAIVSARKSLVGNVPEDCSTISLPLFSIFRVDKLLK